MTTCFTPEMDKLLLKRKPKFLHKSKMRRILLEMRMNVENNRDDTEEYQKLLDTDSLMINFPQKRNEGLSRWQTIYNTFLNLLNN